MKKSLLFLATASSIFFAACSGSSDGNYTQEQLDSILQAKTDSAANALKLQNDSLLQAQADSLRIVDSIAAASKTTTTTTKKTTVVKKKTPSPEEVKPAPKPETVGSGKPKMGSKDKNTVGSGKPKMGSSTENKDDNTVGSGKPKMGENE